MSIIKREGFDFRRWKSNTKSIRSRKENENENEKEKENKKENKKKINRPDKDTYWMGTCERIRLRGTCPRRQTSTIIVDADNNFLASGYNGVPRGFNHCTIHPCEGVNDPPGDSSRCMAIHAEINALLQIGDRLRFATTMYTYTMPCFTCIKAIANTKISRVVYFEEYPDIRTESCAQRADIDLCKWSPKE